MAPLTTDAFGAVRAFADTFDGFVAEVQHQAPSSLGRAVHAPEWYLVTLFGGTHAGLQYPSLRLAHPELAGFVDDVFAAAALEEFVRRKIAKHLRE